MTVDELIRNTIDPRITADHGTMGGLPCLAGSRIPVATIIASLAEGTTVEELAADLGLDERQVLAALQFAADIIAQLYVTSTEAA
jgi:uncharacterized protein (DUF433 family)